MIEQPIGGFGSRLSAPGRCRPWREATSPERRDCAMGTAFDMRARIRVATTGCDISRWPPSKGLRADFLPAVTFGEALHRSGCGSSTGAVVGHDRRMTVRAALAEALSLAFPTWCAGCDAPDMTLCEQCRAVRAGESSASRGRRPPHPQCRALRWSPGTHRSRLQRGRPHRAGPARSAARSRPSSNGPGGRMRCSCRCHRRGPLCGAAGTARPSLSLDGPGWAWRHCCRRPARRPISAVSASLRERGTSRGPCSWCGCRLTHVSATSSSSTMW